VTEDLETRLIGCFKVIFPSLDEKQIRHATSTSVPAWDSMAMVTLVNVVEEEFGTLIDMQDGHELTSFERFLDYMRRLKGGSM
jgi:acyl carrier protein